MFNRTKKVLIGKDIDWTTTDGLAMHNTGDAGINKIAAEGEVLILNKNMKMTTAGDSFADTDTIYIAQVLGTTYGYVEEGGTAVTSAKKLRISDPIEGKLVKSYKGISYTALGQQATVFTTSLSTTVGVTHVLRIQYRDLQDQKGGGQFIHAYRYTNVTGDTTDTINHALMTLVNAHAGARVVATHNVGTSLTLTGKPIPSCTTGVNDIDQFTMVEFDAYLNYIDADGYPTETASTQATTAAVYGNGHWALVRDAEREALGNKGITNLTHFPVIQPDLTVDITLTYDTIIIEHDKSYQSSDNQYVKQAPLKTIVYLVVDSTQEGKFVARLNTWMNSCPGGFDSITV